MDITFIDHILFLKLGNVIISTMFKEMYLTTP